ncbi:MAG TPA: RNA polymerase subunit sigma-24 [Chitinophagaceae bacterium]|jgi:RNA polymerase sigma factor (sigma-70 family)|nr:RNA polymerase subunit sigma-24 [Chitinophagaceae bacterium]
MDSAGSFHYNDQEIIKQLRQSGIDKRRSEEQLFNRFAYFVREGMTKHALSEDESFDAYSDTILAALENIRNEHFEARASLKTYLYQIFHNKCVDLLRKRTTHKNSVHRPESISDRLMLLTDTARSVVQKMMDQADWNLLREKLDQLEDKCRQMLTYWGDNYSDKEIAALLRYKNADVVKTSRLRCLDRLRNLYKAK